MTENITSDNMITPLKNDESNNSIREVHPNNRWSYLFVKRAFNLIASGLFLILFGCFILLLRFINFSEDGHSPIYTSKLFGKGGRVIKFHKIRSMKPCSNALKESLIAQGLNEADEPAFKMNNDLRITKFGKFLRKKSLDELPQIWDIFCDRISVVGPDRQLCPKSFNMMNFNFTDLM